mgnify:CR=1 FL=1
MSIHTPKIDKKVTLTTIAKMKGKEPITMVTAYDALFAQLFDGEVEMILVGDSLNMSFLGKEDTLSATMDQMIYHTQAVCNGAKLPLIVLDMPFGTYTSAEVAVKNATRAYQETNAQAIKIEGGKEKLEASLPLVLGCQEPIAEWKIPNMRGIMTARTKPLNVVEPSGEVKTSISGYSLPPEKGAVKLIPAEEAEKLIELLKTEAKVL